MEITSVCPYCGKEMRDGAIPAYRSDIYWRPKNEDGTISNGFKVALCRAGLFGGYTPARYCESCEVVVVPVPEEREARGAKKAFNALWDKCAEALNRNKKA